LERPPRKPPDVKDTIPPWPLRCVPSFTLTLCLLWHCGHRLI
jgi:hypothetical protein